MESIDTILFFISYLNLYYANKNERVIEFITYILMYYIWYFLYILGILFLIKFYGLPFTITRIENYTTYTFLSIILTTLTLVLLLDYDTSIHYKYVGSHLINKPKIVLLVN